MESRNTPRPYSIETLPRPSYASAAPGRLSLITADSNDPQPSYNTRVDPQPFETTARTSRWRPLTITFYTTLLFQIGALVLALILLIAGTSKAPFTHSKASHAAILLQSYNILDIPIKYPFLCAENQTQSECEPRWSVKVYLNGVWSYEQVQGDYESVHLLQKGMGNKFNLTKTLTIMDESLNLQGQGSTRNYSIPTEPTQLLRSMTPLNLLIPIILLITGMALSLPLFLIWIWEHCALTPQKRAKLPQRRYIFVTLSIIFVFFLVAALYLQLTASKACTQLRATPTYFSSHNAEPTLSLSFQALISGTVALQLATLITFGLHARLEKHARTRTINSEESLEHARPRPPKRTSKGLAGKTEADCSMTPTDLEVIRMTELITLREIHSRRSSISEISEISRLSRIHTR